MIEKYKLDIARAVRDEISKGVELIVQELSLSLNPAAKERLLAAVIIRTFIENITDEDLEEILCMYKF